MDKNWIGRLKVIFDELEVTKIMSGTMTRDLFNIHNEMFPRREEHATGCGACVRRVKDKMLIEYKKLLDANTGL
jgi:NAD-dependent dihydropyrimidine dehydrogenase PreA subunit